MTDVLADADEQELSPQDELFNAYFDDELGDDERAEFEQRLDEDPEFAEAFEMFVEFMGGLQGMNVEAPVDFVESFEETMRSRSRGKLFGQEAAMTQRFQTEIVAAIMLIIMATTYLFFGAPNDKHIGDMTVNGSKPSLEQPSETKR